MHRLQSFFGLGRKRGITPALVSAALLSLTLVSVTLVSVVLFSCTEEEPDFGRNISADLTVSGVVRSGVTGGPLSGATVTLMRGDGNPVETVETSADGSYSFSGVEAGAGYTVLASTPIYFESAAVKFAVSGNHLVEDITLDRRWPSEGTVVASVPANGIAVAPDGTSYIAVSSINKIMQLAPGGTAAVYAGTGDEGVQDGSLESSKFHYPNDVAVSADGAVVYSVEYGGNRVRQISGGEVSTIAGTTGGYSGDGGDPKQAQIRAPYGIAIDTAGNIYIVDGNNNCIRKISAEDGKISTIAGRGSSREDDGAALSAQLSQPYGVAVDTRGNVYISETHRVRKITSDGSISTVVGSTSAGADLPQLRSPKGIVVDAAGTVYVADSGNNRIVKVTADGTASVFAGGSQGRGNGQFYAPGGLAFGPDGTLYICDTNNSRIMKY